MYGFLCQYTKNIVYYDYIILGIIYSCKTWKNHKEQYNTCDNSKKQDGMDQRIVQDKRYKRKLNNSNKGEQDM